MCYGLFQALRDIQKMATTHKTSTRKKKLDWIKAGQSLLIEAGIDAVKLHPLSKKLDISTGSFYHHFKSFEGYLSALADFYGTEQAQLPFDEARNLIGNDPEQRLRAATAIFAAGSGRQLNVAMRAWAHRDQCAFDAIHRYDKVLMKNLDAIFIDLGFDEIAAKSRTLMMMALASIDLDPTLMNPSYTDRWHYIRDTMILDGNQQLSSKNPKS
ncbi:MAG: AcrR family transcriptional regulator [Paraglaciecola psychrophila]|jgi:AcrR family transcriptional regulator